MEKIAENDLMELGGRLEGDVVWDHPTRIMYATDASVYQELPLGLVRPASENDVVEIVRFAHDRSVPVIPRGAGTSLAGQVVGNGLVVDFSRFMNSILEFNANEKWVKVEPGVVLDELNLFLEPHGLFFSPETSTSNRCNIGGMLGNNSCGSHSLIYGTTRDHVLSTRTVLSDGSIVDFKPVNETEFKEKCQLETLEGNLYRNINEVLNNPENQKEINEGFPHPDVKRRNTGYALDELLSLKPFNESGSYFNFSKLIAGSEGTLGLVTSVQLDLDPLPPKEKGLVCVHFESVFEAIRGNMVALKYNPGAVELMDKTVLDCAAQNISQRKNRFFLQGDPGAILIIEFARETKGEIHESADGMVAEMMEKNLGFHYPKIFDADIQRVWSLRKAGLGSLANIPGDGKPVSVIEDTSVPVEKLEEYIQDFQEITKKHDFDTVYHAHISVGELHIRPVLNLKDPADVRRFRSIALDTAHLVKRYRGSLSGEHGDGRVRAEFIPIVIGEANYELMRLVKKTWDPENILNPGKIVDPEPMDTHLRYMAGQIVEEPKTVFNYDAVGGIQRLAEKCNGSGDCRKSALMGGTMCPSYMATKDEGTTTRARANILREFFTGTSYPQITDREVYQVLDLCLSCKGCKSECPSNVDMAKMKAEFLQNFYDRHGIPLRARMVAYISKIQSLGALVPGFFNFLIRNRFVSGLFKSVVGFARERSIPPLHSKTLREWCKKNLGSLNDSIEESRGTLYFFIDEFTNYTDTPIGITAIKLLTRLKFKVFIVNHAHSGRTFFSKGLLRTGKKLAVRNVEVFKDLVNEEVPLVGLEPSAILAFRDEYPELVEPELRQDAHKLSQYTFTIEEFLMQQMERGVIKKEQFTGESRHILFHGHCQQKAVASTTPTSYILSFPEQYTAEEIPSGCCGMAGSFGFEKEHYDLSMKVGELVLFPAIRKASDDSLLAAPGTSCRHQISDGTRREALHPVEILYKALID